MTTPFTPSKIVIYWLYLGIVLVLAMVVIGGITRLTHSGLSMVHWSFQGSLPPMSDAGWEDEFAGYQTSPEFQELHSSFTLSDFKSIYWWEYIHRMFGRMIGIVFIVPFAFFLFKKRIPKDHVKWFVGILALGALQALLGWYMVKSGLIDVPRVSHFRLAAHLFTAFLTCAVIYWTLLKYTYHGTVVSVVNSRQRILVALGMLISVQIIFGAFVAGLKAGWVHNTWPLMDGALISETVFSMEPWIRNFLEGKSGVQFVHRTLAVAVLLLSLLLFKDLEDYEGRSRKALFAFIVALVLQFILGVATLLLQVPITLAVLHQVVALIVVLSLVRLYFTLSFQPKPIEVS